MSGVFQGKIYGIPVPRGVISTKVLYGRVDLLGKEGVTDGPSSWQEFFDTCKQLTISRANTWALTYVPTDYLRQMYGIANSWSRDGDKLTSGLEDPKQLDALEAGRKLVRAKVVNPDAFGAQWQQYKTWLAAGTCLFTYDTLSAWPNYYLLRAKGDFHIMAYGPPKADGSGAGSAWLGSPTNSITAINVQAKDRVTTLLKVLNWLAAPFGTQEYLFRKFGVKGTDYTLQGTDPILTDKGKSEVQLGLLYLADAPWPIYQPGRKSVTQDDHTAQQKIVPHGIKNPAMGLYSETQSRKGGQLAKAITGLENDILQGRKPVSAWSEGVRDWKRNGGDTIRDELQESLKVSG